MTDRWLGFTHTQAFETDHQQTSIAPQGIGLHVAEAEQARCRIVDDQCSVRSVGEICVPSSLVTQDGGIVTQVELIGNVVVVQGVSLGFNVQVNVFADHATSTTQRDSRGCRINGYDRVRGAGHVDI